MIEHLNEQDTEGLCVLEREAIKQPRSRLTLLPVKHFHQNCPPHVATSQTKRFSIVSPDSTGKLSFERSFHTAIKLSLGVDGEACFCLRRFPRNGGFFLN